MKTKEKKRLYMALAVAGLLIFAGCDVISELLGLGGGEEPNGGGNPPEPSATSYFVIDGGDDDKDGLTEVSAFGTLPRAYAAALADTKRKRIVVLSNLVNTGLVTLDPLSETAATVTIAGAGSGIKIERSDGADNAVLEIKGGADITFENILVNGKIAPDIHAANKNNRALTIIGTNTAPQTKVTLEDGAVITGKTYSNRGNPFSTPPAAAGSGISLTGGAKLVMKAGSSVTGCEEYGAHSMGAVYVYDSVLAMEGGEIDGNVAKSTGSYALGGGVYVASGGAVTMKNGAVIGDNTAESSGSNNALGGGVYVNSGAVTMEGGAVIRGNAAIHSSNGWGAGGGVYTSGSSTFTMKEGAVIRDNKAESASYRGAGGGVFVQNVFTMEGGEISGNTAKTTSGTALGGGVFLFSGTFRIKGGVIYGTGHASANILDPANDNNGAAFYKNSGSNAYKGERTTTLSTTEGTITMPE